MKDQLGNNEISPIDSSYNLDDDSIRTIEEVIDVDSGEFILADEFFSQDDSSIINARNVLQLSIKSDMPKYKCPYCDQKVNICGRRVFSKSKTVYFFSHFKDSDNCPIKTGTGLTIKEILAKKYKGYEESKLHYDLKHFIAESLQDYKSKEKGFHNTVVEKTFQNKNVSDEWRRPDVTSQFNEKGLVFELQLSTTFLSVVLDREVFYKLHNTYIIWVFVFFDLRENWQKLMEKDIYYSHKRNVFVLDEDAKQLSLDRRELILKCYWQTPLINENKVEIKWHMKLVSMNELTFSESNYEVFYYNSDNDFFNISNPKEQELIFAWEKAKKIRWERIIERINARAKNCIPEIKIRKKKGLYGVTDLTGNIIIPFEFDLIQKFVNGKAKALKESFGWGYLSETGEQIIPFIYYGIDDFVNGKAKAQVWKTKRWGYISENGEEIIPCIYLNLENFVNGRAKATKSYEKWGYISEIGEEIIPFKYSQLGDFITGKARVEQYGLVGYISESGEEVIPLKYSFLQGFYLGGAIAKLGVNWGVISESGEEIIPFIYQEIQQALNGEYFVRQGSSWNVFSSDGTSLGRIKLKVTHFNSHSPSDKFRKIIYVITEIKKEGTVLYSAFGTYMGNINKHKLKCKHSVGVAFEAKIVSGYQINISPL